MFFVTFLTVILIFIWLKLRKINNYWAERGVKYVKPLPIVGNIYPIINKSQSGFEWIRNMYNAYPGERYCGIWLLTTPILLVRDPDLIRQITVKHFENFINHSATFRVDSDPLWSKNLFASSDTKWRDLRHTLSPAFTGSKMRTMFNLMDVCAKQLVDHLKAKSDSILNVEMKDLCDRYTNDVIVTTSFGIECDSLENPDNEFLKVGKQLVDLTGLKRFKLLIYGKFPTICKLFKLKLVEDKVGQFFTSAITRTIKMRQEKNIIRPDLIHILMEVSKGQVEREDPEEDGTNSLFPSLKESSTATSNSKTLELTTEDMVAQALNFYFGGFDTASTVICLVMHELAANPSIQSRLRQDMLEALGNSTGPITYNKLMQIKYLDMVVSETVRKWPQASWLDRECTKPFEIEPSRPGEKTVKLEKGDVVWIPVYGIHRDPQYYPNPEVFDPERFSDENKSSLNSFMYLPFGVGPRFCIGNRLALLITKIFVFHTLVNFEVVPNKQTQIPLKISRNSLTLAAENGYHMSLKLLS